jgi:hypothetical protein
LRLELGAFVGSDRASDDRARDSTGAAEGLLRADEDVGNVLVLAQERQVEEDLQWFSVGCHDDEFGETAIQSFGGFVGSTAQLLVVDGLLDQCHDLGGQGCVGKGVCLGINFVGLKVAGGKQKVLELKVMLWKCGGLEVGKELN